MAIPYTFSGQTGIIPLSELDSNFSSFASTTDATQGSSLVGYLPDGSGAVGTTVQAKLRESVSVLDFGADPTGVSDSQPAIQAAINANNGNTILFPKGTYRLNSGLLLNNHIGTRLISQCDNGESAPGKLLYYGTFTNAIEIRDSRELVINGFAVRTSTGALTNGFYINQTATPTVATTNIKFSDCSVATSVTNGWNFYSLSGNADLMELSNCYASGIVNGILLNNSQSKMIKVIGGSYTTCTTGINCTTGAFHALYVGFGHNTSDIYLGVANNAVSIIGCQSELSAAFIDDSGAAGAAWPITVIGCRLAVQVPMSITNNYITYRKRGPFNLIGNSFESSGTVVSNFKVLVGGNTQLCPLVSTGNFYPCSTPFSGVGFNTLTQLGDSYEQGSGLGPIPFVSTISTVKMINGVSFKTSITPVTTITVTGAKAGNAALTSLISALATYGLIDDSTT